MRENVYLHLERSSVRKLKLINNYEDLAIEGNKIDLQPYQATVLKIQ